MSIVTMIEDLSIVAMAVQMLILLLIKNVERIKQYSIINPKGILLHLEKL